MRAVLFSAHACIRAAIKRERPGALHYNEVMTQGLDDHSLLNELAGYHPPANQAGYGEDDGFLGISPAMQELYHHIESAAESRAPVFISGETGTGKSLTAGLLHRLGPAAAQDLAILQACAIDRDALTAALTAGTFVIENIDESPAETQGLLLSALPRAQARLVCTAAGDPFAAIREGRLRPDLFYQLCVIPLALPPLRERGDDIVDLASAFLQRAARDEGRRGLVRFSDEAEDRLRRYLWPGNVRQLRNVARYVAVMSEDAVVPAAHLPRALMPFAPPYPPSFPLARALPSETMPREETGETLATLERRAIENALASCGGNMARAAARLGVAASTLYRKKAGWEADNAGTIA